MWMIGEAEASLEEVLQHRRVPAARGVARGLRARFAPLGEPAALRFGPLAGAAWRSLGREAGQRLHQFSVPLLWANSRRA
jgi:hypothetical protein